MIISGIYKIEDVETGNCYIGSANKKNGIRKRLSNHKSNFKYDRHNYPELQEAYNQNPDRIKYEILEVVDDDDLLADAEREWVRHFNIVEGFNVLNKNQDKFVRHTVTDTSKMSDAQKGSGNGNCRLSAEQVLTIRNIYTTGEFKVTQIADMFGISIAHVSNILSGKRWDSLK